jgi:hypothetical protein
MEASTLPVQDQQDGAPVEEGAEATRSADHLFQYSQLIHAGAGAAECEDPASCKDTSHFHAWICMPNQLQHRDVQEKARATKARRKLAMRDAGEDGHPASDAYVMLESELDDLMRGDRKPILEQISNRKARERLGEIVLEVREEDRFENYDQDAEEYRRLALVPEDERDKEMFEQIDRAMTVFGEAIEKRAEDLRQQDVKSMENMDEQSLRAIVREARIEGEATDVWNATYYAWLGFIATKVPLANGASKRYFTSMEEFKNAPPEAVRAIDDAIRDLEARMVRGDAAGN